MTNPTLEVENRDAVEHLVRSGFSDLLNALQDPRCLTSGGRVNVASLVRKLKLSRQRVTAMLDAARDAVLT